MSAAQLISDLTRLGIQLEAHGDRLRYFPRSAVTPDLADRMKAHKGELLAMLRGDDAYAQRERAAIRWADDGPAAEVDAALREAVAWFDAPRGTGATADALDDLGVAAGERCAEPILERFPLCATPRDPVCRCGSTTWRDVPIHGGQSVRRDCGRCGRFLDFPVWYGRDAGHGGQQAI